jgi:hypothetical protein
MSVARRALVATLVVGIGLCPHPASAATVSVSLDDSFNEVLYVATSGETNDLTAHYAADALSVTVRDPGAQITAVGSCSSLSSHSAICTVPDPPPYHSRYVESVRARLGDMNDRAITTGTGPNGTGGINAFGGSGDDVLTGSPTGDTLDGGGGSNLLIGRGGDDLLSNASGRMVRCGRGIDDVTRTRARTRVPPSCESLWIRLPPDANVDAGATASPTPQHRAGAVGFDLVCPQVDGYPRDCQTTVRIVALSNQRLLATGRLGSGSSEDPNRFLRLHMTALGRRLEGDDRQQSAMIVIRGPLMARTAWSVEF